MTNCRVFLKNCTLYKAHINAPGFILFPNRTPVSYFPCSWVLCFCSTYTFLDFSETFNFRYFIPLSPYVFLSFSYQMSQITIGKNIFTSQAWWHKSITNHLRGRRMACSRPVWAKYWDYRWILTQCSWSVLNQNYNLNSGQARWCTPLIPTLEMLRAAYPIAKASLVYS